MFELPSRDDIRECRITKEVVEGTGQPKFIGDNNQVIIIEKNEESA